MVPVAVLDRYGPLANALKGMAKIAPATGIFAIRQGFSTYDDAIAAGKTTEEATRLAWTSALIEGGVTMAFGGMGNAGGLEAIASGAAREQFRRNLLHSASSAWKEGAKAFGVNLLGEMTEEQFIGALDLVFVQMEIRPGMNSADLVKHLYDTAVVSGLSSGGFSAAHGRRVMTEVMGVQGSMGSNDTPGMDGTTVKNATAVADAAGSTVDTAIPTTEDVVSPPRRCRRRKRRNLRPHRIGNNLRYFHKERHRSGCMGTRHREDPPEHRHRTVPATRDHSAARHFVK